MRPSSMVTRSDFAKNVVDASAIGLKASLGAWRGSLATSTRGEVRSQPSYVVGSAAPV